MRAAREAWFEAQPTLDPSRFVFVDETWSDTNMARTRGRCPRGDRLRYPVPHGHWKITTLVAGLRLSGIAAPLVFDGPINRDAFQDYVDRVLVPELAPGDVVVMDNLGSHKGPAVRAAVEAAGALLLFMPPRSPDINPIEMAFAKLKALLRKAAERIVDELWTTIGRLVDAVAPNECANFFAAAGCDPGQTENSLVSSSLYSAVSTWHRFGSWLPLVWGVRSCRVAMAWTCPVKWRALSKEEGSDGRPEADRYR